MLFLKVTTLIFLIFCFNSASALEEPGSQDVEVGLVSWERDFDIAVQLSKQQDKPILALFQEVPGCKRTGFR